MQVAVTHHIDEDEPDAQGVQAYCYEYDLYCFGEGEVTLIARAYADTAHEAHFLSVEIGGKRRLLRDADLQTPLFAQAAAHLRAAGKTTLKWLSGRGDGYALVP